MSLLATMTGINGISVESSIWSMSAQVLNLLWPHRFAGLGASKPWIAATALGSRESSGQSISENN